MSLGHEIFSAHLKCCSTNYQNLACYCLPVILLNKFHPLAKITNNRFANFLSGKDHVTDQEQVDYDVSFTMVSTDGDYSDIDDENDRSADYSLSPSRFSQHHSPSSSSYASSTHSSSFQHTMSDDSPEAAPRPSSSPSSSSSAYRPHPTLPSRAPLHSQYSRRRTDTSSTVQRH